MQQSLLSHSTAFLSPPKELLPISSYCPFPLPTLANTNPLSVSMDLLILNTVYRWNHIACGPLFLASSRTYCFQGSRASLLPGNFKNTVRLSPASPLHPSTWRTPAQPSGLIIPSLGGTFLTQIPDPQAWLGPLLYAIAASLLPE